MTGAHLRARPARRRRPTTHAHRARTFRVTAATFRRGALGYGALAAATAVFTFEIGAWPR